MSANVKIPVRRFPAGGFFSREFAECLHLASAAVSEEAIPVGVSLAEVSILLPSEHKPNRPINLVGTATRISVEPPILRVND
jgi:hypothetical protein